jgi:hypothetical protein
MDILPLPQECELPHRSYRDSYGSFSLVPAEIFKEILICKDFAATDLVHMKSLSKAFYNVIAEQLPEYFIISKIFAIYDNFKSTHRLFTEKFAYGDAHFYQEHCCMKPISASNGLHDLEEACHRKATGGLIQFFTPSISSCDCIDVFKKINYNKDHIFYEFSEIPFDESTASDEDSLSEEFYEYCDDGTVKICPIRLRPMTELKVLQRMEKEAEDKIFKIKIVFSKLGKNADICIDKCIIRGHLSDKVARAVELLMGQGKINITKLNK